MERKERERQKMEQEKRKEKEEEDALEQVAVYMISITVLTSLSLGSPCQPASLHSVRHSPARPATRVGHYDVLSPASQPPSHPRLGAGHHHDPHTQSR